MLKPAGVPGIFALSSSLLLAVGCASLPSSSNRNGNSHGDPTPPPTPAISVGISPASTSLQVNQSQSFTATVTNDKQNKGVIWSISGTGCDASSCGLLSATSSPSGASISYNSPSQAPGGPVTVTATSVTDPSKSAAATINVAPAPPPVSVAVSPSTATIQVKQQQAFTATVQNDVQNKGVTWALSGSSCISTACGTLSPSSSASGASITYTAPSQTPGGNVTLTATSVADSSKSASATINVISPPPVNVAVSPGSATVQVKQQQTFTATVQNDTQNNGVTWTLSGPGCSGAACGTLSASSSAAGTPITYTAPATVPNPASITLTATSVTDTTKSVSASIIITVPPPAISIAVSPTSQAVAVLQSQTFTATIQNDAQNKGAIWTLSGAGCSGAACGTLSATSSASGAPITYTAPSSVPNPATVSLTATSLEDSTKSATATITITLPLAVSVSVSPGSANVQVQQSQPFTATVQNDPLNKGVTWSLSGSGCSGAACGTLSANSSASGAPITYTAPANVPNPATVSLLARSVADSSKSSIAAITITPAAQPLTVGVAPTSQTVQVSQTQTFAATVQNDPQRKGVAWTLGGTGCSGAACGTLSATSSASGAPITYTAPANVPNPATVALTATSISDSSKSASATITVTAGTQPITVSVSPTSHSVQLSQTQTFTATVQNDSQNKGVAWTLSGPGCSAAACGTLSSSSSASGASITYTAPANVPNPATVTLTATSVSDSSKSASSTITIYQQSGNITVNIHPARAALAVSQTFTFTSDVQNDASSQGVTWTASAGTFTSVTTTSALFHAPTSSGMYTVTATSVADSSKSSSASVAVTDLGGVTTYHNNLARDGVNSQEYALTPSNVNSSSFGKLFSCSVDAAVYAQPLWVPGVSINGQTHNVIFVATSHDTVYAFDADANPCVTYWSQQLVPSGETWLSASDVQNNDIFPDIGIVGTPVIDTATQTLYVVSRTKNQGTSCSPSSSCHQRLHALSLVDGSEAFSGPREISSAITVPGQGIGGDGTNVPFGPQLQNQRSGLALVNGSIYVAWGSHGDNQPYHGWLMGFSKSNLQAGPTVFNTTPQSEGGGIWMAGAAPSADSSNNLYVISSNGIFNGTTDFSDTCFKLNISGGISISDWFARAEEPSIQSVNQDLGSSGAVVADLPSSPVPHILILGSKYGSGNVGEIYVLNRDALGHLEGSGAPIVQKFSIGQAILATPVFWNNTLFLAGGGSVMQAFAMDPSTGQFNTAPSSSSANSFGYPGSTPSLSANGSSQAILWSLDDTGYLASAPAPSVLHAYDATNLGRELWNSAQAGSRDQAGNAVKFTVPAIANGKVYIGTSSEIDVYGLFPN